MEDINDGYHTFYCFSCHWHKIRSCATSVTEVMGPPEKMTIIVTMVENMLSLIVLFVLTDPPSHADFTLWNLLGLVKS